MQILNSWASPLALLFLHNFERALMPVLAMLLKNLWQKYFAWQKEKKRLGQFSLKGQKKGAEIAVISDKRTYEHTASQSKLKFASRLNSNI